MEAATEGTATTMIATSGTTTRATDDRETTEVSVRFRTTARSKAVAEESDGTLV